MIAGWAREFPGCGLLASRFMNMGPHGYLDRPETVFELEADVYRAERDRDGEPDVVVASRGRDAARELTPWDLVPISGGVPPAPEPVF